MENESWEPDRERWNPDTYTESWRGVCELMDSFLPVFEQFTELKKGDWALEVGCVLPESEVWTEDGINKIYNIKKEEKIIGGNVIATFSRHYEGEMFYIKCKFCEGLMFTPEHPILVARKRKGWQKDWKFEIVGFKKAKDIQFSHKREKCDYVVVPKFKDTRDIILDFSIFDRGCRIKFGKQRLDEDWASIIGWYLAEGYSDGRNMVAFTLGDELEYAEEILALAKRKNINGSIKRLAPKKIRVRLYSQSLRKFLTQTCGRGAYNKHLPSGFIFWSKKLLEALIRGYHKGDGWTRRPGILGVGSVSKQLIKGIQLALLKTGYPASYSMSKTSPRMVEGRLIKKRSVCHNLEWSTKKPFNYEDENNYYFKIVKKEKRAYSGLVCNLRTSEEIYCVPFVVHNCGSGKWGVMFSVAGYNVVVVDYMPEMLDCVIENFPVISRCMTLVVDDARSLKRVPDKFFGIVMSEGLVEHFLDDDIRALVIKNMARKLRNGGVIICVVPFLSDKKDEHCYTEQSLFEEFAGTGYFSHAHMLNFRGRDETVLQIGFLGVRGPVAIKP